MKLLKLLNKHFLATTTMIVLAMCAHKMIKKHRNDMAPSVQSQVVELKSEIGLCSGIQVQAKSGLTYILSAGHCNLLAKNGNILVITEDGRLLSRRVIIDDPHSDLMLLEGVPELRGLSVADEMRQGDNVHTYTHGNGFATYRTDGRFIDLVEVKFGAEPIDVKDCSRLPKYEPNPNYDPKDFWAHLFGEPPCYLHAIESAMTAQIVPGSSGGAVVNDNNELVGIASATDGAFGYMVSLDDVQSLLKNY